jgi:8-oxo-dGTP diphosphatase
VIIEGKTQYRCTACGAMNARSLVIDNAIHWWIDEHGEYWHESAAAVLCNEQNQVLVLLRSIYPFVYALPAGHVDAGEDPLTAIQREVMEETGLRLPKERFQKLCDFRLPNDSCRRGCDHHLTHLFFARINTQDGAVHHNDESQNVRWLSVAQLASQEHITVPLRHILTNLRKTIPI